MRYWDEMRSKYGFGDGGAVPADAWGCRKLYVEAVNWFAKANGSKFRAVAYNRPGLHNPCMIVFTDSEHAVGGCDDAMDQAVETAREYEVDQYVRVRVTLDRKGLRKTIETGS